jgi:DNA-binding LytR/AlgR family response regulator
VGLVCDEKVRAVLCTASEPLAERLRGMLLRWAVGECVSLTAEQTDRIPAPESGSAQLLFLDLDSVELPEQGRLEKQKTGLIVISRDAGRAIRSYRWHPAALLKPDFDARRLAEALNACEKHWRHGRVCLESPYRRRGFRLPLGSVRFVEAAAHYTVFDQGRQSVRIRYAINELEALLPSPPFARCHRSYLVHLDAVEGMTYTTLTLKDGTSLPLGRTYIQPLREALLARRGEEIRA